MHAFLSQASLTRLGPYYPHACRSGRRYLSRARVSDDGTEATQPRPLFRDPVSTPADLLRELRAWATAGRATPAHVLAGPASGSAPAFSRRELVGGGRVRDGSGPPLPPRVVADMARAAHAEAERRDSDTRLPLPPSFAGDAERVALGHKKVLGESSTFRFACTACGACCRSFADSVMLDPCDLWRMGLAESAAPVGTAGGGDAAVQRNDSSLFARQPGAFSLQLGHFTTYALPPGMTLLDMLQAHTGVVGASQGAHDGAMQPTSYPLLARTFLEALRGRMPTKGTVSSSSSSLTEPVDPEPAEGLLPVVFLKSRRASSDHHGVRRALQPSGGRTRPGSALGSLSYNLGWRLGKAPWDAHLQCPFAVPFPHTPRKSAREPGNTEQGVAVSNSGMGVALPVPAAFHGASFTVTGDPSRNAHSSGGDHASSGAPQGLRCYLGPDHMPTACSLYPLGDLWSSRGTTSAQGAAPRTHFYSLDHRRCEGVVADVRSEGADVGSVSLHSVPTYRARNDLDARRAGGDWFMALATAIASLGPDQALAGALERLEEAVLEAVLANADAAANGLDVHSLDVALPSFAGPLLSDALSFESHRVQQNASHVTAGRKRGKAPPQSRLTAVPQVSAGNALASSVQSRLSSILYRHELLDDVQPDEVPREACSSHTLPPPTMRQWAALKGRIESTAVRYTVHVLTASSILDNMTDALACWTLTVRRALRGPGVARPPRGERDVSPQQKEARLRRPRARAGGKGSCAPHPQTSGHVLASLSSWLGGGLLRDIVQQSS